ncbi:U3 small nucleolar ribonucleo protein complex, subunit Mpp10 [Glomus cerebriforme]|uniref:U3 small nucleolar ribonucleoprotein protein MPP10 n=1 Tax=Glomus cerebriforme TaxID=658196 RepID=A0A397T630_9GLOM|nr:U3 small nucleolar ribonucleo protein complex, subunit Mpp10 [Glomus cerebriforme]
MSKKITKNFLNSFLKNVLDKPEGFIAPDETRSSKALKVTKELYDLGKIEERSNPILQQNNDILIKNNPFHKLIIDNCDNEQIWAEINLQNKPFLNYITSQLSDLEKIIKHEDEEEGGDDIMEQDVDDDMDDVMDDELSQMDINEHNLEDEIVEESDEELRENSSETDEEEEETEKHPELDDEFFNLSEFNKSTEENEKFEDSDDEIDYFADPDKLGDDDEMNANDIKYSDFFDPLKKKKTQKISSKLDNLDEQLMSKKKFVGDSLKKSDNFLSNKVRDLFTRDESSDDESKSAFQKHQEKIKKQIEQLEIENIAEKDWTLVGEASSKDRPINSLLEEDLEFDHIVKPVPVITEEVTEKLEDIIKRRILDETFDDVERKHDPNFRPFLPSKLVEISDEKSKKSLAEIYEDDYIKQTTRNITNEKDEALKKEHKEIENMFKDLCHKLDALSNYHYTPKPPKPEITIIADVPAISMEEIIPVNVSNAKLLAPEEIYDKKKGNLKGETEMEPTEKNQARAAKKRAKKKEKALREYEKKVIEKINPRLSNKHSKQNILDSLIGQKNVTIINKKKTAVKNKQEIDINSIFLKL